MEKKREQTREKIALTAEHVNNMEITNESEEDKDSDSSLDEFIDWRSKS